MGSQEYRKMFFYKKKAYLICNQICANLLSLNEKINPKKKKNIGYIEKFAPYYK